MSSEAAPAEAPKKPNVFVRIWKKMDLQFFQVLMGMKGAIPPTIALAAYQSTSWANRYSTLGYLVAVASMLALPIQPRGKFLRSLLADMIAVLIASCVSLITTITVVAARRNTGGENSTDYNSSAAATSAVWVFFNIWLANTVRAKRPQLMIPTILYIIFAIIFGTSSWAFPNMPYALSFLRRMIEIFFTGFALATGVSLFIVPTSSRMIAKKQLNGALGLMKASILAHSAYVRSTVERHELKKERTNAGMSPEEVRDKTKDVHTMTGPEKAEQEMKGKVKALAMLCTNMKVEFDWAKKEIGWGKLTPSDYKKIAELVSRILMPIIGLGAFIDIVNTVTKYHDDSAAYLDSDSILQDVRRMESEEWEEAIALNADAFVKFRESLILGLTHVGLVLEVTPKPKKSKSDPEKDAGADPAPGSAEFATFLAVQIEEFHSTREVLINKWCEQKGIELPTAFWADPATYYQLDDKAGMEERIRHKQNEQQLYLFLYLEYLNHALGNAVLNAVRYADGKIADGSMKRNRLINPGYRQIKRLIMSIFKRGDNETEDVPYESPSQTVYVHMGDMFNQMHDPEHLPPVTAYQKITDHLRAVPRFMASDAASFGFRAAVATISIGLMAFLEPTAQFFRQQRGVWAMIMTSIGMSPNAGSGVFGFSLRIGGTFMATICCYAIWYMCDQKTGAILPIMWLFMSVFFIILIKRMDLAIACILSAVTIVLVIGYEFQAGKLGLIGVEANGQDYYPIYELAPMRLLTVIIGLTVAFIWTYFPYPVTTHSTLRKDLGNTLYLLGNYYSAVHTTIQMRIKEGHTMREPPKDSPMWKLDKTRQRVFTRFLLKLNQLMDHSKMTKWEPTIGGKFPREQYDQLIVSMRNLFNYLSLMTYSSNAFTLESSGGQEEWLRDFRHFAKDLSVTSQELTSQLCLVSASIINKQPLPPFLRAPHSYNLGARLKEADPNVLSVKHINEPYYAAFAVLEIASSLVSQEMDKILKIVKQLVGETDFSFDVVASESLASTRSTLINRSTSNTASDEERGKEKEKEKERTD